MGENKASGKNVVWGLVNVCVQESHFQFSNITDGTKSPLILFKQFIQKKYNCPFERLFPTTAIMGTSQEKFEVTKHLPCY